MLSQDRKNEVPSGLCIRALNHDNQVERNRLSQLYERTYGSSYPFAGVYKPNFWLRHGQRTGSKRFLDVVAVDGRSFVGHVSIKFDRESEQGELVFIALDPATRQQIFAVSRALWRTLLNVASHQGWCGIHHYCPVNHPANQLVSVKCFGAREISLLPNYALAGLCVNPRLPRQDGRLSILVMCDMLRRRGSKEAVLYPPQAHAEIIRELYASVDAPVEFGAAGVPVQQRVCPSGSEDQVQHSAAGVSSRFLLRFGVRHLTITPSEVSDFSLLRASVAEISSGPDRLFVQVALDDPLCTKACSVLEDLGFCFCGVLPPLLGRHYAIYSVFSKDDVRRLALYSYQARKLFRHIMQAVRQ